LDVFDVKSADVETPVEKSCKRFLDQLDVFDVKSAVVLRGVDQFCKVFWK
jgi:hypothetical protein